MFFFYSISIQFVYQCRINKIATFLESIAEIYSLFYRFTESLWILGPNYVEKVFLIMKWKMDLILQAIC